MEDGVADPVKRAQDEVLRKIGRNVLLFQQLEACLKYLLTNSRAGGTVADMFARRDKQAQNVSKQMMGNLVDMYLRDILADAGPAAEPPDSSLPFFSFSFRLEVDDAYRSEQARLLASVVDQRNELVHNFLPRWDGESTIKLAAAATYLDQQRDVLVPVLEDSKRMVSHLEEGLQELRNWLGSEEGRVALGVGASSSRTLFEVLSSLASIRARPDGWTYLADAGQALRGDALDLLVDLKSKHGDRTLKSLLASENLVDLRDETLPNGSSRTLYRLRAT